MNIFRIFKSGRSPMREENISACVAYLLSPNEDHGMGTTMLANLLHEVGQQAHIPAITSIAQRLRQSPQDEPLNIWVEYPYPTQERKVGYIDVVIQYEKLFIAIENKIAIAACSPGQVEKQYHGLRQKLQQEHGENHTVLMIYLVPAIRDRDEWSVSPSLLDELSVQTQEQDYAVMVTWQPTREHSASFVQVIRRTLQQESEGEIAPLSSSVRENLLACADFALGGFQDYPSLRPVIIKNGMPVSDVLVSEEPLFVGVQHGMYGIMTRAWRNPDFRQSRVLVARENPGPPYLPLNEFKIFAEWAMDPENHHLTGIAWSGNPFYTPRLYLVAKTAGDELFICKQGGLTALQQMPPDKIRNEKVWAVSTVKRTSNWFSGTAFCEVLESKGIVYTQPDEDTLVDADME